MRFKKNLTLSKAVQFITSCMGERVVDLKPFRQCIDVGDDCPITCCSTFTLTAVVYAEIWNLDVNTLSNNFHDKFGVLVAIGDQGGGLRLHFFDKKDISMTRCVVLSGKEPSYFPNTEPQLGMKESSCSANKVKSKANHNDAINDVIFVYISKTISIITCSSDGTIRKWDINTLFEDFKIQETTLINNFPLNKEFQVPMMFLGNSVYGFSFTQLKYGCYDNKNILTSIAQDKSIRIFELDSKDYTLSYFDKPHLSDLLSTTRSCRLRGERDLTAHIVFCPKKFRRPKSVNSSSEATQNCSFNPLVIVAGCCNNNILIWYLKISNCDSKRDKIPERYFDKDCEIFLHKHPVTALALVNLEEPIICSGDTSGLVMLWALGLPQIVIRKFSMSELSIGCPSNSLCSVSDIYIHDVDHGVSPLAICSGLDGKIKVISIHSGQLVRELSGHKAGSIVRISGVQGESIKDTIGNCNNKIDDAKVAEIINHKFSYFEPILITTSIRSSSIFLWNFQANEEMCNIKFNSQISGHSSCITSICFVKVKHINVVCTSSKDQSIRLYSAANWKFVCFVSDHECKKANWAHDSPINALLGSQDSITACKDSFIVSCDNDGKVKLWLLSDNGKGVISATKFTSFRSSSSEINCMALFSPYNISQNILITGSSDCLLSFWDFNVLLTCTLDSNSVENSAAKLDTWKGHSDKIWNVVGVNGSSHRCPLVISSSAKEIMIWKYSRDKQSEIQSHKFECNFERLQQVKLIDFRLLNASNMLFFEKWQINDNSDNVWICSPPFSEKNSTTGIEIWNPWERSEFYPSKNEKIDSSNRSESEIDQKSSNDIFLLKSKGKKYNSFSFFAILDPNNQLCTVIIVAGASSGCFDYFSLHKGILTHVLIDKLTNGGGKRRSIINNITASSETDVDDSSSDGVISSTAVFLKDGKIILAKGTEQATLRFFSFHRNTSNEKKSREGSVLESLAFFAQRKGNIISFASFLVKFSEEIYGLSPFRRYLLCSSDENVLHLIDIWGQRKFSVSIDNVSSFDHPFDLQLHCLTTNCSIDSCITINRNDSFAILVGRSKGRSIGVYSLSVRSDTINNTDKCPFQVKFIGSLINNSDIIGIKSFQSSEANTKVGVVCLGIDGEVSLHEDHKKTKYDKLKDNRDIVITCIDVDSTNNLLFLGTSRGFPQVFNYRSQSFSNRSFSEKEGHRGPITAILHYYMRLKTKQMLMMVSASLDGSIIFWELDKKLKKFLGPITFSSPISSISIYYNTSVPVDKIESVSITKEHHVSFRVGGNTCQINPENGYKPCFLTNSSYLIVGCENGMIHLCDFRGSKIRSFDPPKDSHTPVSKCCIFSDFQLDPVLVSCYKGDKAGLQFYDMFYALNNCHPTYQSAKSMLMRDIADRKDLKSLLTRNIPVKKSFSRINELSSKYKGFFVECCRLFLDALFHKCPEFLDFFLPNYVDGILVNQSVDILYKLPKSEKSVTSSVSVYFSHGDIHGADNHIQNINKEENVKVTKDTNNSTSEQHDEFRIKAKSVSLLRYGMMNNDKGAILSIVTALINRLLIPIDDGDGFEQFYPPGGRLKTEDIVDLASLFPREFIRLITNLKLLRAHGIVSFFKDIKIYGIERDRSIMKGVNSCFSIGGLWYQSEDERQKIVQSIANEESNKTIDEPQSKDVTDDDRHISKKSNSLEFRDFGREKFSSLLLLSYSIYCRLAGLVGIKIATLSVDLNDLGSVYWMVPLCSPLPYISSFEMLEAFVEASINVGDVSIFNSELGQSGLLFAWRSFGRAIHLRAILWHLLSSLIYSISLFYFEAWSYGSSFSTSSLRPLSYSESVRYVLIWILQMIQLLLTAYFIHREYLQFIKQGHGDVISHFSDIWNCNDMLLYLCVIIGIISRILYGEVSLSRSLMAVAGVSMYLKILYYMRAFGSTGPLVSMIFRIAYDIRYVALVLAIVILGFAQSFWILSFQDPTLQFGVFKLALLNLFDFMLGNFNSDFSGTAAPNLAVILYVFFMFIVTILILNLIIALMGESFAKVNANGIAQWRLEQAMIIVEQECLAPDSPLDEYGRPTQYPQFLHVLYRDVDLEIDNNNTTTTTEQMAEKANEASSKIEDILAMMHKSGLFVDPNVMILDEMEEYYDEDDDDDGNGLAEYLDIFETIDPILRSSLHSIPGPLRQSVVKAKSKFLAFKNKANKNVSGQSNDDMDNINITFTDNLGDSGKDMRGQDS